MSNFNTTFKKHIYLFGTLFLSIIQANAQFTISDNFKSSSVVDVVLGDDAKLTSGQEDPVNAGWLRLTPALGNKKGYAYVNKSFPSTLGVVVDFEYTMWRGTSDSYNGADGLSVFLFDAQYGPGNFQLGAYGGSLGYANRNTEVGLRGGYLGLGLDAYGNFGAATEGKNGGASGVRPNALIFRGPTTGNLNTTNPYRKGVTVFADGTIVDAMNTPAGIATQNVIDYNTITATRPTPTQFYRRVQVEIKPTGTGFYDIIVRWTKEFGGEFEDLMTYQTSDVPPTLLKVGFAASTGGGFNNHEVRNLLITTPGNLRVVKRANKDLLRSIPAETAANEITYNIEVVNDTDAALDKIDFSDHLTDANGNPIPNGMFSIESITHTGFLSPGTTLPSPSVGAPITSGQFTGELHLAANSKGTIVVKGKLNAMPTGNFLNNTASAFPTTIVDQDLLNNTSTTETPVVSEKSDLIIKSHLDQSCLNTIDGNRFNLTVSNIGVLNLAYGNSSQSNRLTVTTTFPAGVTRVSGSWSHSGWTRTGSGSTYTFTRTNAGTLASGQSLPPISYTLQSTGGGYTNPVTVASTAEPIENQNNNSASSTVDALPNAPTIANSPIYYCLGALAASLQATALPGHTLLWYLNPGGAGSTIPFTPSTSTSGSTTFYVSQKGPGGCESAHSEIEVIVLAKTTSGAISGNQTICHSSLPALIYSSTPGTGPGTLSYRWEISENEGTTWNPISGANASTYQPPILQKATWYRRITVATGNIVCESEASDVVAINIKRCKLITNPNIYNKVNKN